MSGQETTGHEVKGWCPGALRPMMSGDGLVVRLLELGVGDCAAHLTLPAGDWTAWAADPSERAVRSLAVNDGAVDVAMRRSGMVTLRLGSSR